MIKRIFIIISILILSVLSKTQAQNTALIVVDIQNDYFAGGRMELVNAQEAAEKASLVIQDFRKKNLPVIFIRHINPQGASFFCPDTQGSEINQSVAPKENEKIFIKHFPNSFRQTGLDEYLKSQNISTLVIVGMMTHMCIDTTVRAAADLNYSCTLIEDACATRNLNFGSEVVAASQVQAAYMAALNGAFCRICTAGEFVGK